MKAMLLLPFVFATGVVWGGDITEYFVSQGKQLTKKEALKTLLLDNRATVWKCTEVTLSDKLTIKRKHDKGN